MMERLKEIGVLKRHPGSVMSGAIFNEWHWPLGTKVFVVMPKGASEGYCDCCYPRVRHCTYCGERWDSFIPCCPDRIETEEAK